VGVGRGSGGEVGVGRGRGNGVFVRVLLLLKAAATRVSEPVRRQRPAEGLNSWETFQWRGCSMVVGGGIMGLRIGEVEGAWKAVGRKPGG
jgi:hypothetical protein